MSGKGVSALHPKQNRGDQRIQESDHDPYHAKLKLKEPTTCSSCAAVFKKGHWTWAPAPDDAKSVVCPACQRMQDRVPAGFLRIDKEYFNSRKDQIMSLIHHTETRERQSHPMKRIMDMQDSESVLEITFTDPRLARNIGDALKSAYGGSLNYQYTSSEFMLRVTLTN